MESENILPEKLIFVSELLLWLVPAYLALAIVMSVHYFLSVKNDQQYALHNERVIVDLIEEVLGETLTRMSADAKNLSYVTRQVTSLHATPLNDLKQYFIQLSTNNPNYDQIRYIDTEGWERIRINNNAGEISVVNQADLQNKAHRYYWQYSNNLQRGQVYISPMDLNVEEGVVQKPLNPTIRVGTPVFNEKGSRTGVIILNYKAKRLIDKLYTVAPSFINHVYLFNPQGVAVIHPTDSGDVSYAIDTQNNIPSAIFEHVKTADKRQILEGNNYYTYAHVSAPNNGNWTIISEFPESRFNLSRWAFVEHFLLVYGLLFFITGLVTWLFSRYRVQTRYLTEQKQYEQQFRHTLENIQLAAVSINRAGVITFCNDYFLSLVGYQKDEVIGYSWIKRFIPDELQVQAQEALDEAIRQQTHQPQSESVVLSKSGEIHLVSWTSTFTESKEKAVTLTLLGEDVTEHKMAQEQLQQLSHAVESSQNSVMITDIAGQIVYVNPVFCELSGYSRDEVMGRSPKFLQSGEMESQEYQSLWQTLKEGKEWQGEFHNRKKSGELYWERARISPVKDVENRTLYYVAVKQDITEEKRLAKEVERQTNERIQHEKLAEVGKVVNMIAHDLRNPLSSIKMVLQIQERANKSEMFRISLEQVKYMEAILEELLAYSKPEQLQPTWLDINKLLEAAVASQQKQAKDAQVAFDLMLHSNLPTVYVDPVKMRQAIQNILINSIQATGDVEDARVKIVSNIMITESGTELIIDITNNGHPIDPCMVDKVFEPFFTTKAKGTGLGLAIVKRIIDSHDGKISLSPHSSSGTLARIRLPTTPKQATSKEQ
ncbi:PAS domain S-box protein [Vibrio sp. SCSIO 43137]|uniref:PAS domain S-box protein n=1 Tax=Vibrio sp. SCSIO 43137 TaxID=3021011 RepID=UPI002307CC3F|nr:PAS domain S-box protein [Vibrio sp. SCSIO 43137]WCE31860.1 PAS domain S-box protein [Vibrio sp. SCSIO 43137]